MRLLAVVGVAAVAAAAGALVVWFLCKPRRARRAAVVVVVAAVLVCALLVSSSGPPALAGEEVLIGQPFAYATDLDVVIDGVDCDALCVVEVTGTSTVSSRELASGCYLVFNPVLRLIGRRGTIYEPRVWGYECPTVMVFFGLGASDTDEVIFDVTEHGVVDRFDVRGNDEVAAVVMMPRKRQAGPDHYALVDPYKDQSRSWAAAGLVKLVLFAAAGAAGAALLKLVLFLREIRRRNPTLDPTGSLVADPDVAERVLGDLIRGARSRGPDISE
jgi:hypothetical protein